jgi:hypothetical protein
VRAPAGEGRLFVDPCEPMQERWSRRSTWITGSESAYALLAKFAALNALSNRDLCELLVLRKKRGRATPYFPKVDLRSSEHIRTGRLANLLGVDAAELQLAFVNELFPNATKLSSNSLVWCTQCAHHGFHSAAFQLNFFRTCPVHRVSLRRACPKCTARVPYALHAGEAHALFVCPQCGADFAGELRTHVPRLALDDRAQLLHRNHIELVRFVDTLPTLFDACRSALGQPGLPIQLGKPDGFRGSRAFRQFVADVLIAVSARALQPQLAALRSTAILSLPFEIPPRGTHGGVGDRALAEATAVYRCLKRKIYRHFCRGHGECIRAAMKTFWWDPEGERTGAFCPTAVAFLRWRMAWEGRRIPNSLDAPGPARTPLGLVAWLASEAPIGSPLWTHQLDAWIRAHLLACACFDSFAEWQDLAHKTHAAILWRKDVALGFRRRHWACSGRGTVDEPAMLFIEQPYLGLADPGRASGAHLRHTRTVLGKIRH